MIQNKEMLSLWTMIKEETIYYLKQTTKAMVLWKVNLYWNEKNWVNTNKPIHAEFSVLDFTQNSNVQLRVQACKKIQ